MFAWVASCGSLRSHRGKILGLCLEKFLETREMDKRLRETRFETRDTISRETRLETRESREMKFETREIISRETRLETRDKKLRDTTLDGRPFLKMFPHLTVKSETTLVNQLSILFHKCGLRFYGDPGEHHVTTQNACYPTLLFHLLTLIDFI